MGGRAGGNGMGSERAGGYARLSPGRIGGNGRLGRAGIGGRAGGNGIGRESPGGNGGKAQRDAMSHFTLTSWASAAVKNAGPPTGGPEGPTPVGWV